VVGIDSLRSTARSTLGSALGGARKVALVNFPNHGNPGDPAIWLGTRRLLRELDVQIGYSCAWWDFDATSVREAVGDAPVLINGGGNFGDLYAGQQAARVQVLKHLRDNPVIQLPQSIHFSDPANERAMAELIAEHPAFTMMVRDHQAEAIARERLGAEPVLSPDHALGLGPLSRTKAPEIPILWLARLPGDPEYVDHGYPIGRDVRQANWLLGVPEAEAEWDVVGRVALRVNKGIRRRWRPGTRGTSALHVVAERTYVPLAWRWVRRGLDLLCTGQVVVTNTLHGHILATMLGIPNVVLDSSYGKVSGIVDAWTADLPGVFQASDGKEAVAIARQVVRDADPGSQNPKP
jgi:exopolysaccharide biosynthesis predicted pyruvyltransferase EpsI